MLSMKEAVVKKILSSTKEKSVFTVIIENKEEKAINYPQLTGEIYEGDTVILNTTAIDLELGTGGYHFVIYNNRYKRKEISGDGHIMKLRYTPMQFKVLSTEEQNSPNHEAFISFKSLDEMPVIVGLLHSMLLPIATTIKYHAPNTKITYIMTDGGALPIDFSDTVIELKKKNIIDYTITSGHSFGGDLECINIYNSLIAAKEITNCDLAIVAMGPGIVGTGTPYGFSGIEQGINLDAVNTLNGTAIAVPRISFVDERNRHKGLSHHSIKILHEITKTKCYVPIPILPEDEGRYINKQIKNLKLYEKHYIVEVNANSLLDALNYFDLNVNTMGRDYKKDPSYFMGCSGAAMYGLKVLKKLLSYNSYNRRYL